MYVSMQSNVLKHFLPHKLSLPCDVINSCVSLVKEFTLSLSALPALSMSMKVPRIVEEARQALADGHCVVIGLQTTGEVRWRI